MSSTAETPMIGRRAFLKEGPLAFLRAVLPEGREARPARRETSPPLLRPPGAAPEAEFLELCCGIGACAEACPVKAIRVVPHAGDPARHGPVIVAQEAPCVVCEGLDCMRACPSGALTPVSREEIRIGFARVNRDACWAWAGIDPGCDYCVDRCPLGPHALIMTRGGSGGRGPVVQAGCVGCGVCEFYCPTRPSAIAGVRPRRVE